MMMEATEFTDGTDILTLLAEDEMTRVMRA
jgi:hypothetical protein